MKYTNKLLTILILGILLGSMTSAAADDEYKMTLTVHSITISDDHDSLDDTGEIYFVVRIDGAEEYTSPENSMKVHEKYLIDFSMTRLVSLDTRVTVQVLEADVSNAADDLGYIVIPLENISTTSVTNSPGDAEVEFSVALTPTVIESTVSTTITKRADLRIPLIAVISLVTIYFLVKVLFPEHTSRIPPILEK